MGGKGAILQNRPQLFSTQPRPVLPSPQIQPQMGLAGSRRLPQPSQGPLPIGGGIAPIPTGNLSGDVIQPSFFARPNLSGDAIGQAPVVGAAPPIGPPNSAVAQTITAQAPIAQAVEAQAAFRPQGVNPQLLQILEALMGRDRGQGRLLR